MIKNIKIIDIIIYVIISIIVLIPILHGKLFLLDFIPALHSDFDLFYGKVTPEYGGTLVFNLLLPISIDISQKLILFTILFVSGYSMYFLMKSISLYRLGPIYSGILYMINPFVYTRLIAGHWLLLFSYAILPFLLNIFINFLENRKKIKGRIIMLVLSLSLIAFNIHILLSTLFILFIIMIFWIGKYKNIKFKSISMIALLFLLLNSYWIWPIIASRVSIASNIENEDLEAFAPKGDLLDVASMYGFWNEDYIYSKNFIAGWQIIYLTILSLSIMGFLSYFKDEKIGIYITSFAIIGIIGLLLSMGINGPFNWFFEDTVLKVFRDSQKFVSMIVLAYSVLGGLGIDRINYEYNK